MFYTRVWSILRMFYTWDLMHKKTLRQAKCSILWTPPYLSEPVKGTNLGVLLDSIVFWEIRVIVYLYLFIEYLWLIFCSSSNQSLVSAKQIFLFQKRSNSEIHSIGVQIKKGTKPNKKKPSQEKTSLLRLQREKKSQLWRQWRRLKT